MSENSLPSTAGTGAPDAEALAAGGLAWLLGSAAETGTGLAWTEFAGDSGLAVLAVPPDLRARATTAGGRGRSSP